MPCRPQKITFGEMRSSGVRGVLVYCADFHCTYSIAISADAWPDHIRLSDLEPRLACKACGKRGADVRPDFDWKGKPTPAMDCQRVPWSARLNAIATVPFSVTIRTSRCVTLIEVAERTCPGVVGLTGASPGYSAHAAVRAHPSYII